MGVIKKLAAGWRRSKWQAQDAERRKQLCASLKFVGVGFEFDSSLEISFPDRVAIGKHVYIGPDVQFYGRGGLQIDDHVIVGPEVVVMTSMHNYRDAEMVPYDRKELLDRVVIGRCVWVGFRVIILPGVDIGEGSIIGAGAVVTKSCKAGSILGGNPARIIGQRDMAAYERCIENQQFYLMQKQLQGFDKEEVVEHATK